MPRTERKYPEWVQAYRTKGMTVKKKGESYYLYKRTSRRVPGKKYPQPVDTYVGIITPDGLVRTQRRRIVLSDIEVWEYGFSYALWELCPQGWKNAVGKEWEDLLVAIIADMSPGSYLAQDHQIKDRESFHCSFANQRAMLDRRLHREYKMGFDELAPLKTIYLLKVKGEEAVSKVSNSQQEILNRFGLKLED